MHGFLGGTERGTMYLGNTVDYCVLDVRAVMLLV